MRNSLTRVTILSVLALYLSLLFAFSGCSTGTGGGFSGGVPGMAGSARLIITLPFPKKGSSGMVTLRGAIPSKKDEFLLREIPQGTTYFAIYIYERGTTQDAVPPVRVDRPATGDSATAVINNVPIGWKTIRILASNAANEALAEALYDVQVMAGDNPEVTMVLTPTLSPLPSPSPMPTPTLSPSPTPEPSPSPSPSPQEPSPTPVPPGPGPSPTLESIIITPSSATMASGGTQQYSATGYYSDSSSSDLTASASWTSSDESVGTISSSGLFTALVAGTCTITATSGSVTSNSSSVTVVAAGSLKWSNASLGYVYSAPAIGSDGTLYVGAGSPGKLYAVSSSGSLKWSYPAGNLITGAPAIGSDGTVYFGSRDSRFYAVDSSGSLKWSISPGGWTEYATAAFGSDGTVYIGTVQDARLHALNPSDGSEKWNYSLGDQCYSSASIGSDGTIYIKSNYGYVFAVSDGTTAAIPLWSKAVGSSFYQQNGSPAIGSDGTVYIAFGSWSGAPYNSTLYALDPSASGSFKWSYNFTGWATGEPAVGSDGTIYFGNYYYNTFYALDASGTLKWSFNTGGAYSNENSPCIANDGTIYVSGVSATGRVNALNSSGSLKWSYSGYVSTAPALSPDGTVYFGYDSGLKALYGTGLLDTASPWPKFHHDIPNNGRQP
ncbi:MAG: PQQ-binding-like beta-propeller repeat protein [Candidatus Eremiobacteraeota bacterium]|nr:PQQ-binding-like beta-propeller repeat protein [Candidatus Eremiobacteraeota bacterium]